MKRVEEQEREFHSGRSVFLISEQYQRCVFYVVVAAVMVFLARYDVRFMDWAIAFRPVGLTLFLFPLSRCSGRSATRGMRMSYALL